MLRDWKPITLEKRRLRGDACILDANVMFHILLHHDGQKAIVYATMSFPTGGPLERSLYLQPFSRYCALSVLGSQVWPFNVSWRHRSRDHTIAHIPFPIGGPLEPSLSLTVSEIFNVKCNAMVDMTLIRPLNKGQGHSFFYQSISHIRLKAVNRNFGRQSTGRQTNWATVNRATNQPGDNQLGDKLISVNWETIPQLFMHFVHVFIFVNYTTELD